MTIQEAWNERRNLRAEGNKLCAKGGKFYAEGYKLITKGTLLFYNAVMKVYGHYSRVKIKWEGEDCEVCGVKYFFKEPSAPAPCEGKIVKIDDVKYKLSEEK